MLIFYINETINSRRTFLDSIHRLVPYLKKRFGDLVLLGPTEYVPPEDRDRIQSPELCVLNKR
jgi:hypothetical protein